MTTMSPLSQDNLPGELSFLVYLSDLLYSRYDDLLNPTLFPLLNKAAVYYTSARMFEIYKDTILSEQMEKKGNAYVSLASLFIAIDSGDQEIVKKVMTEMKEYQPLGLVDEGEISREMTYDNTLKRLANENSPVSFAHSFADILHREELHLIYLLTYGIENVESYRNEQQILANVFGSIMKDEYQKAYTKVADFYLSVFPEYKTENPKDLEQRILNLYCK